MGAFNRFVGGLGGLFRNRRMEQELDAELRDYLETAVEQKMSAGMNRDSAMRAARAEIGSLDAVKDRVRDVGWESVVTGVGQDVRFAFRLLRKQPGFTMATIAMLALGIGGTTAIFSIVDALFLRAPDGVSNAATLRKVYIKRDAGRMRTPGGGPGSWTDYVAMRKSGTALTGIGAYMPTGLVDLGRGGEAQQVFANVVSHDYLSVLGVRPVLGRVFVEEDDGVPGAHPVTVISHRLWRTRFGSAGDAIGKTLLVNGVLLDIVGVTAEGFTGVQEEPVDVWLPSSMAGPLSLADREGDWRKKQFLGAGYVARLAPDIEDAAAIRQAAAALRGAVEEGLDPTPEVLLSPLVQAAAPGGTWAGDLSLWLALVAAMVLIIACANVANLLLARAITRRRELAIRLSLGAGAWRVARQHLTESIVLASLGGIAGVVLARWAMDLMHQFPMPPAAGRIDARLLVFAVAVSILTGMLFGILPAVRAVQVDPVQALKESRSSGALRRSYTRRALVVLQMSLSLALLVGAALFVRSLWNANTNQSGVDIDHALIARVDLRRAQYTSEAQEGFYESALTRLSSVPGVERAAVVHLEPFHGGTPIAMWARPGEATIQKRPGTLTVASPGYFEAAGIRLVAGRTFDATDRRSSEPVAVVDEAMARVIAPDGQPLGLCVPFNAQIRRGGCTRIVGVVERQRRFYLDGASHPSVFLVREQAPNAVPFGIPSLIVRTRNPVKDAPLVRAALQALRPDLPYVAVQPLTRRVETDIQPYRLGAMLFSMFGVVALALAAVGLYGVLGYFVNERTPEIGIRRTLGAPLSSVVGLVVRQGLIPVGAGLLVGLCVAFAGTRYLASLLFGIEPLDLASFASASAFLLVVALIATLLPAWRAARVDPLVALRQE